MIKRHFHKLLLVSLSVLFCLSYNLPVVHAVVFSETFNDNVLDVQRWRLFSNGSAISTNEINQRLEISFSGQSTEGTGGFFMTGVANTCKMHGDFDVQTDYSLITWPQSNGVRVGLSATNTDFDFAQFGVISRASFGGGEFPSFPREAYFSHSTAGIQNVVETTDQSGKLRIARIGNKLEMSVFDHGEWILHSSATVSTADVGLMLGAWGHSSSFAKKGVIAAFDNFQINSGTETCPFPTSTPVPTATPTSAVVLFKQNDPRWANKQYANETGQCATIAQCGCALTSIAMVLNHHGVTKDPNGNPTTPDTVNEYFKKGAVCRDSGCISVGYRYGSVRWPAAGQYSEEAHIKFGTQKIVWNGLADYSPVVVTEDIQQNNPDILKVLADTHWAVATGIDGNTFSLNDPAHNKTKLSDNPYNNTAFAVERYKKTSSDFSSFEAVAKSPAKLLITDPDGKQSGFDTQSNTTKQNIPNSYAYFEGSISDDTGVSSPPAADDGINTVIVTTPKSGKYTVKVIGAPNKLYSLAIYGSDRNAGLTYNLFEATPSANINHEYEFSYSPEPGTPKLAQTVKIDILPFLDKNILPCQSKLFTIPVALLSSEVFNIDNIDLSSIRFEGAAIMTLGGKLKFVTDKIDVNFDGKKDLLMSFRFGDTSLTCQSTSGSLTGKMKDGFEFRGSESVKMIK